MPFENKGQYNFDSKQAYGLIKEYNKTLRDKGITTEEEAKKSVAPRTVNRQSGFFK
jgi:hypothetical protein